MNANRRWAVALVLSGVIIGAALSAGIAVAAARSTAEKNKELVRAFGRMFGDAEHLEASAARYLTEDYIQHDTLAPQGRAGFVQFFREWYRDHPEPAGAKPSDYLMLVAEGDIVVAVSKELLPEPGQPGKKYEAFFFDMWRVQGGKLAEHWDDIKKCSDGGVKCYWP